MKQIELIEMLNNLQKVILKQEERIADLEKALNEHLKRGSYCPHKGE